MYTRTIPQTTRSIHILLSIILLSAGLFGVLHFRSPQGTMLAPTVAGDVAVRKAAPDPVSISIPSAKINASMVPLGLTEKKEIEVPKDFTKAGWYIHGAKPGTIGPAVIVGHLDDNRGKPATFWSLKDVKVGDRATITREDGSYVVYEITEKGEYSQDSFPTEKVYGTIDHAGIRLITCTGRYNILKKRYTKNLIVFGKLVNE